MVISEESGMVDDVPNAYRALLVVDVVALISTCIASLTFSPSATVAGLIFSHVNSGVETVLAVLASLIFFFAPLTLALFGLSIASLVASYRLIRRVMSRKQSGALRALASSRLVAFTIVIYITMALTFLLAEYFVASKAAGQLFG